MRARDLAVPYPTVSVDTDAFQAARTLARERLPGLIVCDSDGRPYTVLPGSQVLRALVPSYVQEDPRLARAYDEKASDELTRGLAALTVGQVLHAMDDRMEPDELPIVDADATTIEIAAVMAQMHSPVVAVVQGDGVLGAVTVSRLLEALLPDEGA